MPTTTYIALANLTVGTAQSTITFSSIPNTYRDLVLVCAIKMSVGKTLGITINDDTGSNYIHAFMRGDGGAATSASGTYAQFRFMGEFANVSTSEYDVSLTNFQDYSATDKHKTMLTRNNQADSVVELNMNRWTNTNAITKLSIAPVGGGSNFTTGSTFTLFGIVS